MRRRLGLAVGALVVAAVIAACRPSGDVGYVEIKTVPVAALTQTRLYLDDEKLAPIKKGSAVLREPVGTRKLAAEASPARRCRSATSSCARTASPR